MTKPTNFQLTTEFNAVLGQGVAAMPLMPTLEQCRLRLKLINEEAQVELTKAFDSRNLVQVADAIGDGLVTLYGAANDCGLDADAIMERIHQSNMSKLCDNEQDAIFAVEQYRQGNGFHGKTTPINAVYRQSAIEGKFVVFDADSGKTLKGPGFFEPVLEDVVYPNGRQADPFDGLRKVAEQIGARGETLWQFNSVLDQIALVTAAQQAQAEQQALPEPAQVDETAAE